MGRIHRTVPKGAGTRVERFLPTHEPMLLLHAGQPIRPHDLPTAWPSPVAALVIVLAAVLYRRGVRALWSRAGRGRGISAGRHGAALLGFVALFVALASPLDAASDATFAAHMVQHLVLMLVAAPLLAAGSPALALLWNLAPDRRQRLARWWVSRRTLRRTVTALAAPLAAGVLHSLALWLWHLPALYDAAVEHTPLHLLEHMSFFWTALLFWWPVTAVHVCGGATTRTMPTLAMVLAVAVQGNILGALLTLSPVPWYTAHLATTGPWGLTPLEDQQVAGALMWIPGSLVYLAAILVLSARLVRTPRGVTRSASAPREAVPAR